MANHTESGIIAVGADGSRARIANEIKNSLDKETFHPLYLTDEGKKVLRGLFSAFDVDVEFMLQHRGNGMIWLNDNTEITRAYLIGMVKGLWE